MGKQYCGTEPALRPSHAPAWHLCWMLDDGLMAGMGSMSVCMQVDCQHVQSESTKQQLLLLPMLAELIQAPPPLVLHLTLPCSSQAPTWPPSCSLCCQACELPSRQVESAHAHAQGSIIGSERTRTSTQHICTDISWASSKHCQVQLVQTAASSTTSVLNTERSSSHASSLNCAVLL